MSRNDLRYIKTDNAIRKSFVYCVKKYGFEKTSITMICEKALIGRKTFYLHYLDKYDLLDKLFEEFEARLREYLGNVLAENIVKKNVRSSTEYYCDVIYSNREDFLFLAECSREKTENSIYRIFMEAPIKKVVPDFDGFMNNPKKQLSISYLFAAMVAFTEKWLGNTDAITKEEATEVLFQLGEKATLLLYDRSGN